MTRIALMFQNPRRMFAVLALLAIAASAVAGSGAVFTSDSSNPGNLVTAGNLKHTNNKDGAAIFTASKLVPGQSADGTVVLTNDGDVAAAFSLAQSNVTSTPGPNGGNLSTKLDLKVEDVTVAASPVVVYNGKFNAVPNTALDADPVAAGNQPFGVNEARTYKFTVTFPDGGTPASATSGDNAFKSSQASAQFNWTSVS